MRQFLQNPSRDHFDVIADAIDDAGQGESGEIKALADRIDRIVIPRPTTEKFYDQTVAARINFKIVIDSVHGLVKQAIFAYSLYKLSLILKQIVASIRDPKSAWSQVTPSEQPRLVNIAQRLEDAAKLIDNPRHMIDILRNISRDIPWARNNYGPQLISTVQLLNYVANLMNNNLSFLKQETS